MRIFIYQPGAHESEIRHLDTTPRNFTEIDAIVRPIVGQRIEHVTVLWEGRRADMFVGEESAIDGSPFNKLATDIYHAASKARGVDTTLAPPICGPAVVFDQIVWR